MFDGFNYGCQYALWRLFYESEYLEYVAEMERLAAEEHRKEVDERFGRKDKVAAPSAPERPPEVPAVN